ncbi:MAG: hypothetical protein HZC55_18700 [Verrucomicrobia bacterium]|jgi:hypothetical protein|nr:hypothetical protein [Verrucomicrobiota bacterium]
MRWLFFLVAAIELNAGEAPIRHAFLAADPRAFRAVVIDEEGRVGWSFGAPHTCDAFVLPGRRVLLSDQHGARIVNFAGDVLWDYRAPVGAEVYSCEMLANGSVLVGEGGTKRLVEVDATGRIVIEIPLVTSVPVHGQVRTVRKLPDGAYLVCFYKDGAVREILPDGRVRRSIDGLGEAYYAERLADGNTLIGCGDRHRAVEIDPAGRVVWEVNENDLPGHPLRFVGQVRRLANGHTLICNWPAHGHEGGQPLLVEITRDKRIAWSFDGRDRLRGIIGLQLLDGMRERP